MVNLERKVLDLRLDGNAPTKPVVLKMLNEARRETVLEIKRRSSSWNELAGGLPDMCKRTEEKRYINSEFTKRVGQPLTDARKKSLYDPIYFFNNLGSFNVISIYAGRLPATSKSIFDGTTIKIKDGAST